MDYSGEWGGGGPGQGGMDYSGEWGGGGPGLSWAQMALALLVPFKGPGVSRAPSPPLTLVIHSTYEIYYTGAHKNHLSACD